MAYPSSIDSFTNPSGTSLVTSPDHAALHTSVNGAITAIETAVGTTLGTNALKNFAAGDLAVRQNSGGTIQGAVTIGTQTIIGGTASNLTLGTPVINQIASTGTTQPTKINQALAPTVVSISDVAGGTLSINAALGQVFSLSLGTAAGNRTLATPTNATAGQSISFMCKTSGSANGTLVWDTGYTFSQNYGTPTLGTGTFYHYFGWRYNSITSKWDFQGASLNCG